MISLVNFGVCNAFRSCLSICPSFVHIIVATHGGEEDNFLIGERLAELRRDRRMTQKYLAETLCVSTATVSAYECNRKTPSDEVKVKIAKRFNISLDYLLGAIDEKLALDRSNEIIFQNDISDEVREKAVEYVEFLHTRTNRTESRKRRVIKQ